MILACDFDYQTANTIHCTPNPLRHVQQDFQLRGRFLAETLTVPRPVEEPSDSMEPKVLKCDHSRGHWTLHCARWIQSPLAYSTQFSVAPTWHTKPNRCPPMQDWLVWGSVADSARGNFSFVSKHPSIDAQESVAVKRHIIHNSSS